MRIWLGWLQWWWWWWCWWWCWQITDIDCRKMQSGGGWHQWIWMTTPQAPHQQSYRNSPDRLSHRGCSSGGVHVPVFIHMPGECYHKRFGSLLCSCNVFSVLINALCSLMLWLWQLFSPNSMLDFFCLVSWPFFLLFILTITKEAQTQEYCRQLFCYSWPLHPWPLCSEMSDTLRHAHQHKWVVMGWLAKRIGRECPAPCAAQSRRESDVNVLVLVQLSQEENQTWMFWSLCSSVRKRIRHECSGPCKAQSGMCGTTGRWRWSAMLPWSDEFWRQYTASFIKLSSKTVEPICTLPPPPKKKNPHTSSNNNKTSPQTTEKVHK